MPKIKLNPRQLRNLMVTILLSFVVALPILSQPLGLSDVLASKTAADNAKSEIQTQTATVLLPVEAWENVDQVLSRSRNENMANLDENTVSLTEAAPDVLDGEETADYPVDAYAGAEYYLDEAYFALDGLDVAAEAVPEEAVEPQPAYTEVDYVLYISANQLNLRAEPSTESAILAELKFGDKVSCVGENADWMKVSFNGTDGYVKTEYTSQSMVFSETSQTVYVSANKLNLRQDANTDSEIITTLTYMTKLTCSGVGDGWSRVKTSAGQIGYVASQYLTTKAPAATTSKSSGSSSSSSGGTASRNSSGNSIVDYAYSALGVKYVSGGSSMSGFDCSGLASWCYRQVGITISRSASSYYSVGTAISYSNIQPGDILCMDTRRSDGKTSITHVGIYVGNGNMIHASSTNGRVVLQDVSQYLGWGVQLLSVRRVVN